MSNNATLITIGSDRKLSDTQSSVWERLRSYAQYFESVYVVVFSLSLHKTPKSIIENNVHVLFTNVYSRLFYVTRAYNLVVRLIKRKIPNSSVIISTQDPFEAGFVGALVARRFKIPLHVQIHTDISSPFFQKASLLNRIRIALSSFVLRRADAVRVVSPKIATYVNKKYGVALDRIQVLPIMNEFISQERTEEADKYVLIVGRLEKEKRVDVALRSCKPILEKYPKLLIKIAGSGKEQSALENMVSELGISDRVKFLGDVQDVSTLYAHASCLLHTALYEGFGLVLFEAMCTGCPIVSTDVGIANDLKDRQYDIVICNTEELESVTSAVELYTTEFKKSTPVDLEFMASNKDIYNKLYVESIYKAGLGN